MPLSVVSGFREAWHDSENSFMNTPSVLELQEIHKAFGDTPILKGVDITINKGDVKSIIGPSGSGKSTLLRCANLLERPDSGKVLLEGKSILDGNINASRARIGFVFQDFNLFLHLRAIDNVALCLRRVK